METLKQEEFSLEQVEKDKGNFYFTAKSLSQDFECEDGLKRLSRDSINKHLIWRHKHPIEKTEKRSHIYGRVVDSWLEDDGHIWSKYQVYDHTPDHLALQELIEKRLEANDPLGISMQYRTYSRDGRKIHYDVFEHSGTPIPKCSTCKTTDFGIEEMANEDQENEGEQEEEQPELQKHIEKIKELEERLNSKTSSLEEYESKIATLEQEIESKESELKKEKEETMTLEEKVDSLQAEVKKLEKKPIVDKLFEIENDEELIDWYYTKNVDFLEQRLEKKVDEAESTPITKDIEDSANEANVEDGVNEEEEVSFEQFTSQLSM